ncbi:HAD-IA family hydrolase [Aquabacterium sp. OR-4]|uniref:HAD-IA family hydrolase n=1 Tax=Aquabacterium sp. OR-4 TaxID=2978127 RepID=UPI0028CA8A27|nr:HAD-IA family hydrolase [Aquabacterium sp. OR-4]MDT7838915.1 HAD-IA family hydrolase [Aquabacterium sp. OR-4]
MTDAALPAPHTLPITAVIFDMDGLLLDTEGLYTRSTQAIAERFGKTFDWQLKQHSLGLGALPFAQLIVERLALPITPQQFLDEREPMLQRLFAQVQPMPGAAELVRHLSAQGVPIAVATSSRQHYVDLKSRPHADWFALFDAIVTPDDPEVHAAKPAPDLFAVAAQRIGAVPARTLAFEDSPNGVLSAVAAGLRAIAVPDAAMDRGLYPQATAILGSLREFQPQQWGLPPMPTAA